MPRLPRKGPRRHGRQIRTKRATQCHKCHACHAKRRWMWVCATPATWNLRRCDLVPHLPREMKVDVTKYHACHANSRGVTGDKSGPSAPPNAISATLATQNEGGCEFVPHLPRETKVDVTKYHACHAKCRGVTGDKSGPSAPPNAISATPATQNDGGCEFVPRLPREMKVHGRQIRTKRATQYHEYHACHAKCRGVTGDKSGPSAPPSTMSATPATQNDGGCEFVPRLPRQTKVDVTKCHACHAKCRGVTGDKSGPSVPPSTMSATPATQNDGGCEFVPRLPRQTKVDVTKCHACHAKCRGVTGDKSGPSAPPSTSATPATQNDGGCEFVPRLPRQTKVDVTKCHACHAKCRGVTGDKSGPSAPPGTMSATPATQNDRGCQIVPRPRNDGGCHQVPRSCVCVCEIIVC